MAIEQRLPVVNSDDGVGMNPGLGGGGGVVYVTCR